MEAQVEQKVHLYAFQVSLYAVSWLLQSAGQQAQEDRSFDHLIYEKVRR